MLSRKCKIRFGIPLIIPLINTLNKVFNITYRRNNSFLLLSFIKIGMHINGTKYQCHNFKFFLFFFIIKNNKTKRNMFDTLQIFAKIDDSLY